MCGLAGFIRTPATPDREAHSQWLRAMGDRIIHRGPDASGVFMDDGIALVHRRLSILDLSSAGTQPMVTASGRYVIAYNGEIYNYRELRRTLEQNGSTFHTGTDTEVVLALFEQQGLDCLTQLNGMFALAVWDSLAGELYLARDRLGKKPLYYYNADGVFAFGSEIKALMPLPFFKREIRADAVKDFFAYQYIPDPKTIYRNVHKLEPGHWLKTDGQKIETRSYWNLSFQPRSPVSPQVAQEELYALIEDAVRIRMVSDVPLGAFLSGGIDSSAIVGLMANQTDRPVTTCSIGFDSKRFDEVDYARDIAQRFKTDHHEFTVRENVPDHLADIARFFDEPFADPSFVPTYFVSQLARQQVTVALAGDGGDENFAGYSKYRVDDIENRIRRLFPSMMRHSLFPRMAQMVSHSTQPMVRKANSLLNTLSLDPETAFFITNSFFRQSVWQDLITDDFRRQTQDYDPAEITRTHYRQADAQDHVSRILYTDIKTYLPGDILVKVDRMSMANSLETRAPLLDYRVVEYAASLPASLKLNGKEKKHVLKQTFRGLLPDDVLYRKKMGFSVPLADWLRNEISGLADQAFSTNDGGLAEYFDMNKVRDLWGSHRSGSDHYTQELWSMLAFDLWWRSYGE